MDTSITWPLVNNVIRANKVNHTFGMVRTNADGTPRPHQGWDFSAKVGEPAYAIADGTVVLVKEGGDYGLRLALEFKLQGSTYYAFYAHLQKVFVAEGSVVTMNQLIAEGKTRFVVDFSELSYISSAGLRVLLSTAKKLKPLGGLAVFANLQDNVLEVFEMTGFSTILGLHDSVDAALAAL